MATLVASLVGWEVHRTPCNKLFFLNRATGADQWTCPAELMDHGTPSWQPGVHRGDVIYTTTATDSQLCHVFDKKIGFFITASRVEVLHVHQLLIWHGFLFFCCWLGCRGFQIQQAGLCRRICRRARRVALASVHASTSLSTWRTRLKRARNHAWTRYIGDQT